MMKPTVTGGCDILDKTIHDIIYLNSNVFFDEKQYALNDAMIVGTSAALYTVLRFSSEDGKNII